MLHFYHPVPPWGRGPGGNRAREGTARTQIRTLGLLSSAPSTPFGCVPQDQMLWGKRVWGTWQERVPAASVEWQGQARPSPPLAVLCVTKPGWQEVLNQHLPVCLFFSSWIFPPTFAICVATIYPSSYQ